MHAYIQHAKTYTANTYMHRYIQKYKKKTTKKSILVEYVRQKSQKTLSELIAFIPTGGSNLHKHATREGRKTGVFSLPTPSPLWRSWDYEHGEYPHASPKCCGSIN